MKKALNSDGQINSAQWGGNKYEISLDKIDWTSKEAARKRQNWNKSNKRNMGMFIVLYFWWYVRWSTQKIITCVYSYFKQCSLRFIWFVSIDLELWADWSLLLLHSFQSFFIFKSFIVSHLIHSVHKRNINSKLQAIDFDSFVGICLARSCLKIGFDWCNSHWKM